MGDTLDFPAFPGQPELDGMDRAQLLSCLERIQLMLEHLDSCAALRPFTASPPSRLLRPVRTGSSRAQPCHSRR